MVMHSFLASKADAPDHLGKGGNCGHKEHGDADGKADVSRIAGHIGWNKLSDAVLRLLS